MIVKAVFATKIGDEDWKEQFLTDHPERIEKAQEWARLNGFDRIRVVETDLSTPPDWRATVNV
jgi:hypothetical protein